ncbi:MAG: periplasmic heavy metal sensor [Pseudomonadota bacterium]
MSETEPKTVKERRGAPRWMKWLLIVSLSINLLIAGFAIGAAWRFRHGPPNVIERIKRFAHSLPTDRRDAVLSTIETRRATFRELRRELRRARRALGETVAADAFNAAAYQERFDAFKRAQSQLSDHVGGTFGEIAAVLTVEQRRKLLRYWRHRRRFGRRFRGGDG